MQEDLDKLVRDYNEKTDKNKMTVSYSKIDLFDSCHMKYKIKYIDEQYPAGSAIQFDFGTLLHKIMELKARAEMLNQVVDYNYLEDVLENGIEEQTEKGMEKIVGLTQIRKTYFEQWYEGEPNYEDKVKLFKENVMRKNIASDGWRPIAAELPFLFVYRDYIFHGFIDRVDINDNGDIRVIDYKSSKKVYEDSKLKTPLQMFIYGLAIVNIYQKIPSEYIYDFISLNKKVNACSTGYIKRGLKKLDRILDNIEKEKQDKVYAPSPTPLCYWCDYSKSNPYADVKVKYCCDYYSLWTPSNKTYEKNKEWDSLFANQTETVTVKKPKLIF